MILNRLFLSEEYKQYLTFSVEISTNTPITQYSKHLWSDEQEHTHKRIKSLRDSGKGELIWTKVRFSVIRNGGVSTATSILFFP